MTNTNPGNLRDAPWFNAQSPAKYWPDGVPYRVYADGKTVLDRVELFSGGESVGWFCVFQTRAQGIAAIYHEVALHTAEEQSLTQLIEIWAPASNGNLTQRYIENVATWCNVKDVLQPLQELLPAL